MDASGVLPAASRNRKSENPDALDKELTTLTPAYLDCLLQSLENAYGYEGRVTHLGGQATAILFLKCLREKTNRQIVLNGGIIAQICHRRVHVLFDLAQRILLQSMRTRFR